MHRIEVGCAIENVASIRVLEKVGMTREGRKRQVLPIRANWIDNYFFAILEMHTRQTGWMALIRTGPLSYNLYYVK